MTGLTRRAALLAAAGFALPAAASEGTWPLPEAIRASSALAPWDRTAPWRTLPLDVPVVSDDARPTTLRRWIDGRPTLLVLWATWCAPCLRESPDLARLSERLERADAHAAILALQAFDDANFNAARRTLDRLDADSLRSGRATEAAERALVRIFGASRTQSERIGIPALLLIAPDGSEIARRQGLIETADGGYNYWREEETFDLLMAFGRL